MRFSLTLKGIDPCYMTGDTTRLTFQAKSKSSIYNNMLFLHLKPEEAEGLKIGQEFTLEALDEAE